MANAAEMIGKLVETIRSAHDKQEADKATLFASGYIRALDDFNLITPEESRSARTALRDACDGWSKATLLLVEEDAAEGERAVNFVEQNAARLGVTVERDGDTVHLKRVQ